VQNDEESKDSDDEDKQQTERVPESPNAQGSEREVKSSAAQGGNKEREAADSSTVGANSNARWHERCDLMKKYMAEKGHSNPEYEELFQNVDIGVWAYQQRRKHVKMTEGVLSAATEAKWKDRFKMLEDSGFYFEEDDSEWGRMLRFLEQYKKEHGHCKLGMRETYRGEDLGQWVQGLRAALDEGSIGPHSKKAIQLREVGFEWRDSQNLRSSFEEMMQLLIDYKKEFEHVTPLVREVYKGRRLGNWISKIRLINNRLKRNYFKKDYEVKRYLGWIEKLNTIGFVWKTDTARAVVNVKNANQKLSESGEKPVLVKVTAPARVRVPAKGASAARDAQAKQAAGKSNFVVTDFSPANSKHDPSDEDWSSSRDASRPTKRRRSEEQIAEDDQASLSKSFWHHDLEASRRQASTADVRLPAEQTTQRAMIADVSRLFPEYPEFVQAFASCAGCGVTPTHLLADIIRPLQMLNEGARVHQLLDDHTTRQQALHGGSLMLSAPSQQSATAAAMAGLAPQLRPNFAAPAGAPIVMPIQNFATGDPSNPQSVAAAMAAAASFGIMDFGFSGFR